MKQKLFSSFLKGFHLPEIVTDLRIVPLKRGTCVIKPTYSLVSFDIAITHKFNIPVLLLQLSYIERINLRKNWFLRDQKSCISGEFVFSKPPFGNFSKRLLRNLRPTYFCKLYYIANNFNVSVTPEP